MKNLLSKNYNASCYINIVIRTLVHLEYPEKGSENFEKMFIDHGLLNLQPEPLEPESILAEVQLLENNKEDSTEKKNQYNELLEIFHSYEFASETLGLFIDNYDCLAKHKETSSKNGKKLAKFVVSNDISIGSILSESMLIDSIKELKGNTIHERLQILLNKILSCKLPNPDTFNEENIVVKLLSNVTSVEIAKDNKFIKFAEQIKSQEKGS
ncbi:MAG: hypothetical protein CMK52_05105 [Proteobacteria bacterium]|nr:hypothetical protein [Pseudomonadota bacterium]|tara:strand:+ start:1876 stop:2511 length:636 start_codon:yes stop_codon:yes gene_type:complete